MVEEKEKFRERNLNIRGIHLILVELERTNNSIEWFVNNGNLKGAMGIFLNDINDKY